MGLFMYKIYTESELLDEDKEALIKLILDYQKEHSQVLHDYFSLQDAYEKLQENYKDVSDIINNREDGE